MALKNSFLKTKTGNIDITSATYAEILITKKEGIITEAAVLIKKPKILTSYRDEIDINDIEPIEDFFIDNDVNYFIITRN